MLICSFFRSPSRTLTELLKQPAEPGAVDGTGVHHPIGTNGISARTLRSNNGQYLNSITRRPTSVPHVWQGCRAIITSTWGQYWVQSSFTCQQNLSNDNKGLWRRLFLLKFEFPKEAAQEAVVDFCLILFSFSFLSPFFYITKLTLKIVLLILLV